MGYLKTGVPKKIAVVATCFVLGIGTMLCYGSDNSDSITTEQSSSESSAVETTQTSAATYTVATYNASPANTSWSGAKIEPEIKGTVTTKATTKTKATTTTKAATTTKATTTTQATTTTKAATTTTTTAATTKPAVTTSKKINGNPAVYDVGGSVKERLNSVKPEELKQTITVTGNEKAVLEKYMKALVNDKMTNYEKVLTCYDYLITHTYYAYGGWNNPIQSVLERGFGTCTEYSHTMCAMLRYMGFKANCIWGKTAMAAGGYGQHMWVELYINGNTYVVDPQVDDNMTYGSNISHKRFVKLYSETPGNYIRGSVES